MLRPVPPAPPRRPTVHSTHGDERVDDWHWLANRDDPAVLSHLEAENAYTEAALAPRAALRDRIYAEITSHIQETDTSAPVPDGPYEYYARTVEGQQYPVHCRRPRGGGAESVVIDENAEANGHDYFALGGYEITPDHAIVAYSVDTNGGERYSLRFRDIATARDLPDVVDDVTYGLAWAAGNVCFYVRPDAAMRAYQVWRHTLGTPAAADILVYEESDERFNVAVRRTRSGHFVLIESASKMTAETLYVPTDTPDAAPRSVVARRDGHEYAVEHHCNEALGHRFLIVTNTDGAQNFKLVAAPVGTSERGQWTELVAHREAARVEDVDAFSGHLVLTERVDGLETIRVLDPTGAASTPLAFPDPVYLAWVGANAEYDTATVRIGYTSLVAPASDVDVDLGDPTAPGRVVKTQPVPGYDPASYTSMRLWAPAADGARVPISLVHRHDTAIDGTAPTLLYGYGSYEHSIDPTFRASRLSLLDRGFVYAIAHVRGGGELGRPWYEGGRLANKSNTFSDFIAAAEYLIAQGYAAPDRIVARGGSAGGLLMGVVANLRPDLFAGIVAEVPFVDVVTTMLDPSLPLTIAEWEEWGDPREPDAYERMKSYSPYDNVTTRPYPAMLVTTGLNDPRVQFWEPVKWVTKLRVNTTSDRPILLRTELGAGHSGPSGRYDAWREEAQTLSFVCDAVGITQ